MSPSSSTALPRPILKHSPHSYSTPAQAADALFLRIPAPRTTNNVRFPPSPTLTRTFSAYSPSTYDRSPIVVLPNTCALPARGCPGRTYLPGDAPAPHSPSQTRKRAMKCKSKTLHPRAAALATPPADEAPSIPPPLVPDLSSESDESDGFTSPPTDSLTTPYVADTSFLPHPPSPKPKSGLGLTLNTSMYRAPELDDEEQYQYHTYEDEKRRRRERERGKGDWEQRARQRRERDMGARDLEKQTARMSLGEDDLDDEDEADEPDLADSCGQGRYRSIFGGSLRGCGLEEEDGCLGGF
ncbi:hypothetical protein BV25DRAFT_815569 [Artomyces pyxidatus]|uniref:Uncharacterized protein n=1 Tax=Artomyces pyxidatus TaxID=48021 RepID=A0ACB8SWY4_9AGAM|nr:hypothetical protein BV25DRAFT_815569 [Artomyces pyxidatus]